MQGPHQKWQEQASATAALVTCGGYAARCDEDDPGAVSHAGQERPGHQQCLQAQRATTGARPIPLPKNTLCVMHF